MRKQIIVFASGHGSNLQAILDACERGQLPCRVALVVCNRKRAQALNRAKLHHIRSLYVPYIRRHYGDREVYEAYVLTNMHQLQPHYDLIVLAGWMHVFGSTFLARVRAPVINLHPALPGTFPGLHAIERTFEAHQAGRVVCGGLMIHHVVPQVDAGTVLGTTRISILAKDTVDSYRQRIQSAEKPLLLHVMTNLLSNPQKLSLFKYTWLGTYSSIHRYEGKVRSVWDVGYGVLAFVASNRQSAFDRHLCDIPDKGALLTAMSAWWFERTRHIIPNHYRWHEGAVMMGDKLNPIKVEVVVRGYITGSTKTSIWPMYERGERVLYGITFPEGLKKNQKLNAPIITPTTKDEVDEPLTEEDILQRQLMTLQEWATVKRTALALFKFGQEIAEQRGLILVDTKYEFGRDVHGRIVLMDEVHTVDSSRFWFKATYAEKFTKGEAPQSFDKDVVRRYVRETLKLDPYNDTIPDIPSTLIYEARSAYLKFYQMLTGTPFTVPDGKSKVIEPYDRIHRYLRDHHRQRIIVVAGSTSDVEVIDDLLGKARGQGVYTEAYVASAHKQPRLVLRLLAKLTEMYQQRLKVVIIAVAGRSNALGGMLSANTSFPVINCPPFKDKTDMLVNVHSSLQNPSNVPALTVLDRGNAVLAAKRILTLG